MVLHSPTHYLICFFIAAFVKGTAPFDGLSFILVVDGLLNYYFVSFLGTVKKSKNFPLLKKSRPLMILFFPCKSVTQYSKTKIVTVYNVSTVFN
jgi:hypothetical protein